MSKEEIVKQLCDGWVGGMTPGDEQRIVYPAMDLYAEEMSIEFFEWWHKFKKDEVTKVLSMPFDDERKREAIEYGKLVNLPTDIKFQLFLQSKNKHQ